VARVIPAGKLPHALLEPLLAALPTDPRVLVGAAYGEDAAVIAGRDDECWVVTTDPITFAGDQLGWYLVQVNANDIAVMGATPEFLTATLLFPAGSTTPADVEACFHQIGRACAGLGIAWIGGHTEITPAVTQAVACGQMIGRVSRSRLVTSSGGRAGDDLVLVGWLGIEGTAILARERGAELPADLAERAARLLFDPGIGITRAAHQVCQAIRPHALHDPTEGGLATAVREMAVASGLGAMVFDQPLPVLEPTRAVCEHFGVEVLGLLSSGCLLVACDPADTACLPAALRIGRLVSAAEGFRLGDRPLPVFERDELARVAGAEP
jgi:hydrogenase maturation factor